MSINYASTRCWFNRNVVVNGLCERARTSLYGTGSSSAHAERRSLIINMLSQLKLL